MQEQCFVASDSDSCRALAATADLLDSLRHRSIAQVAEFTQRGTSATLTVKPAVGPLLSRWRAGDGAELARTMAEVATAVAYLHSEGIHLGGIRLEGVALLANARPVLFDARGWSRRAGARLERADTASLGRALGRLVRDVEPQAPGWRQRLCGAEQRLAALGMLARSAESGRLGDVGALATRLVDAARASPAAISSN